MSFKDDQLIFRCFQCKKKEKDFNKDLIDRVAKKKGFVIKTLINLFCY